MKNIVKSFIAVLTLIVVFTSCSSTKNAASGTANVSRGKFVGTWTCSRVSYEGLVQNAVQQVFDQAPPQAFVGSVWKLTNSGNGIYTLTNGASQTIFWSVYNGGSTGTQFQFKKLYQGDKAKNVEEGYRLDIAGIDGTGMTLKSAISVGNSNGYVIYTFTKN